MPPLPTRMPLLAWCMMKVCALQVCVVINVSRYIRVCVYVCRGQAFCVWFDHCCRMHGVQIPLDRSESLRIPVSMDVFHNKLYELANRPRSITGVKVPIQYCHQLSVLCISSASSLLLPLSCACSCCCVRSLTPPRSAFPCTCLVTRAA